MSLNMARDGIKSIVEDWKTLKPKKEEFDDYGQPIHHPNAETLEAIKDGYEGRVFKIDNLEEFFKEAGL